MPLQLAQRRLGDAPIEPRWGGCRRHRGPIEDPRVRFQIAHEVVRVPELHARAAREGAIGQAKRTARLPDARSDEGIDLTDGGQAVVVQTIGDVVGVPLCLGAMVGGDNVVVMQVDDMVIMDEFAPLTIGAARYV